MSRFVVDGRVAVKWLMDEPGADAAAPLLEHSLAAPDLLGPERATVLWRKVMRGELSAPEAETMAAALAGADIAPHPTRRHWQTAITAACTLRRPASNGVHRCLAAALAQPLVTADARLVGAVRASSPARFAALVAPLAELPQILGARPAPGR